MCVATIVAPNDRVRVEVSGMARSMFFLRYRLHQRARVIPNMHNPESIRV